MTKPSFQKQAGFTLVEIMIVVAIIALLAAIAVPGFLRARKRSQASRIINDLRLVDSAVDQYAIENAKLTGDAVEMGVIDRVIAVSGPDAMHWSKQLARKEGIFVGITAGATFAGALQVCREAAKGSTVLCMLPDTGERYLSTPLFADIPADMTDEELLISRSTPATRMAN